jgi:hypothetical protein
MRGQRLHLLVSLFTRRFFENDLLAPDIDLRPTAIWLLTALATPGFLWSAKLIVPFGLMVVHGYQVVEFASWWHKGLLIMLAMVNAAVVTVVSWEALLVDRRDALILGSVPLAPRLVVIAKALAIARLFATVTALSVPGTVVFVAAVYSHFEMALAAKALIAHAIAVAAASLSTCLILTAALVIVTSLFGGRWLRAMTVLVQVLALVAITGLVMGIQWAGAIQNAAVSGDAGRLSWTALWPPGWFLGMYQVLLGVSQGREVFIALAQPALVMMAVAVACVPMTLLLWSRSLRVLVSAAPGEAPEGARALARTLPALLARRPLDRALIQFFLATLWRSPRHRLAVLTAAGLAMAVSLEGSLVLVGRALYEPQRWLTEFAVPVLVLLSLLAVFRWLLTVPAELPASWVLGLVMPTPGVVVRRAVGRVLVLIAVVPALLLAAALSVWQGGLLSAAAHASIVLVIGLSLVEHGLSRVTSMPFATEYLPGRSNLKARWPIHALVLLVVVPTLAELERSLVVAPDMKFVVVMAAGLAWLAWARHQRHIRRDQLSADPGTGADWTPVQLRIGWTSAAPDRLR